MAIWAIGALPWPGLANVAPAGIGFFLRCFCFCSSLRFRRGEVCSFTTAVFVERPPREGRRGAPATDLREGRKRKIPAFPAGRKWMSISLGSMITGNAPDLYVIGRRMRRAPEAAGTWPNPKIRGMRTVVVGLDAPRTGKKIVVQSSGLGESLNAECRNFNLTNALPTNHNYLKHITPKTTLVAAEKGRPLPEIKEAPAGLG